MFDPPWWDPAYLRRQQLTLTALGSPVAGDYPVRIELDLAALSASGLAADGNDLHVAMHDGTDWTELGWVLVEGHTFAGPSTEIMVRLPEALAEDGSEDRLWLYFDGPPEGPLEPVPPASRFFLLEETESQSITGPNYQVLQTLAFTLPEVRETWLCAVSWQGRSDDSGQGLQRSSRARVVVDGVPRPGTGQLGVPGFEGFGRHQLVMFPLSPGSGLRTVALEGRDNFGSGATFDDVRILVFMLPDSQPGGLGALQFETNLAAQETGTPTTHLLSVEPGSDDQFLAILSAAHKEAPGTAGGSRLFAEAGGSDFASSTTSAAGSAMIPAIALVDLVSQTSVDYEIGFRHEPATNAASTVAAINLMAFNLTVFADIQGRALTANIGLGQGQTTTTTLDGDTQALPRDAVMLASITVQNPNQLASQTAQTTLRIDGLPLMRSDLVDDRMADRLQAAMATGFRTAGGEEVELRTTNASGPTAVAIDDQLIYLLRYPEVSTLAGPIESLP